MRTLAIRKGWKTEEDGNHRVSYTISGLTYGDLFRIHQALLEKAYELDKVAKHLKDQGEEEMSKDFKRFAEEAREIARIANRY